MTCDNARDTITQTDGQALPNYQISDAVELSTGGHFNGIITSHCRVDGGMWVAWIQNEEGDGIDAFGTSAYGDDQDKVDWPSLIASTNVLRAGYFPDDGSPSTVYELAIDPVYNWNTAGTVPPTDHCSRYPFIGDWYANNGKAQLTGWAMLPIDLQIRTDGTNVWLISLACESVKYPYLWNNPLEVDDCGNTNPTFETDWFDGHSDPFFHDWDASPRNYWWLYRGGNFANTQPFGPYDDPGWSNSFRWQPARVTVWAGDLGGFTRLDTLEAQFDNFHEGSADGGLCSGIECAASSAEPGMLHILWAEGGNAARRPDAMRGQRINYSRWDTAGKTLDVDVRSTLELGSGYVSDDVFVWTAEMILRNDHGSPSAIVWPWTCAGGPQFVSPAAEYWDLSGGTANVVQTLDSSLIPTPAEGGVFFTDEVAGEPVSANQQGFGFATRSQFASSLYTDPLDDNNEVYLLCVKYTPQGGEGLVAAFYRIRADGSATFEFMDGIRLVWYSIIAYAHLSALLPGTSDTVDVWASYFQHDFVSDPDNVWVPLGANVMHLDRQCLQQWELLTAFPVDVDTGYASGKFFGPTSPPPLVTLDDGDWLLGGGQGPLQTVLSADPTYVASLKAKICRCCLPCMKHVGLHIWEKVGGPSS